LNLVTASDRALFRGEQYQRPSFDPNTDVTTVDLAGSAVSGVVNFGISLLGTGAGIITGGAVTNADTAPIRESVDSLAGALGIKTDTFAYEGVRDATEFGLGIAMMKAGGSKNKTSVESRASDNAPVQPGERDLYGNLIAKKKKHGETEAMDMDHRPSFAAQVKAAEEAKGEPLTKAELAKLKKETPAVATPRKDHQQKSRTYGGRNNKEQIAEDAKDLETAAAKDDAAYEQ
jgi:filamentous hemagglutinin